MFLPPWRSRKDGLLLEGCSTCQLISVWASRTILAYPKTNLEGLSHLSNPSFLFTFVTLKYKISNDMTIEVRFQVGGARVDQLYFWILSEMELQFLQDFLREVGFQGKKTHGLFGAFCQPFRAASILPSSIFSEGLPSKLLMKSTTESFQTKNHRTNGYEMVWS